MYIIIVGLGGIGRSLVKQAVEHGNNVVVIDQEEARCSEILEHYDILAITGMPPISPHLKRQGSTGPMHLSPPRAMMHSTL